MDIQKDYQEYAFLPESSEAVAKAEAVSGAISKWPDHRDHFRQLVKRTYEHPIKWYYVVFKPFNKSYNKFNEWYQFKGIDACRKHFKRPKVSICVKETVAAKTHVHALVATSQHLVDGYNTSKYKLHVAELSTIGDRERTLTYLIKESNQRPFILYQDYIYHPKNL